MTFDDAGLPIGFAFSKNQQIMTTLRRHSPLPHHAKTIAITCGQFGLNPNDKDDRNLLLVILADVIFKEPGKAALGPEAPKPKARPGRHKTWNPKQLRVLRQDIMAVMTNDGQFDPHMTVRRIRQHLQKKSGSFGLDYLAFKDSTLEKYIGQALLPQKKSE
jgi:hypothetical protein